MKRARVHHAPRRLGGSGRWWRAHSRPSVYDASAFSWAPLRTDPDSQANIAALPRGCRDAGWVYRPAICGSTCAGVPADSARLRELGGRAGRARAGRNHGGGRGRPYRPCCRRPVPFRSYSCMWSIRVAPASSKAWRVRAATLPASCLFEYGPAGKWLDLLKEAASRSSRALA